MKPKASELVDKINQAKGNIAAVARAYHVSRRSVYDWIQSYPTAQQALADQRHSVVDDAESVLYKMVINQNFNAVAYVLNNSPEARARGWAVKQTDVTSGGEKVQPIQFVKINPAYDSDKDTPTL